MDLRYLQRYFSFLQEGIPSEARKKGKEAFRQKNIKKIKSSSGKPKKEREEIMLLYKYAYMQYILYVKYKTAP